MCGVHRTSPNLSASPGSTPYRPPGGMGNVMALCTRYVCGRSCDGQCNDILTCSTGLASKPYQTMCSNHPPCFES